VLRIGTLILVGPPLGFPQPRKKTGNGQRKLNPFWVMSVLKM